MGEVGGGVGDFAGGFFHEVLGEEAGAVGVDVFLHPVEEGDEVATFEGGGDAGILHGGVEELGGVDIS